MLKMICENDIIKRDGPDVHCDSIHYNCPKDKNKAILDQSCFIDINHDIKQTIQVSKSENGFNVTSFHNGTMTGTFRVKEDDDHCGEWTVYPHSNWIFPWVLKNEEGAELWLTSECLKVFFDEFVRYFVNVETN